MHKVDSDKHVRQGESIKNSDHSKYNDRFKSSKSDRSDKPKNKSDLIHNFTVDHLFPSETNKSGTKGKRLDINTIFSGVSADSDVVIDMSHEILIERKIKRREELQRQYTLFYKKCWEKIDSADKDTLTETIYEILPNLPQYPEYSPKDCLNYIQNRLRKEEFIDTLILDDNLSIYINWSNVEANRSAYDEEMEREKEREEDEERDREKEREKDKDSVDNNYDHNYSNNNRDTDSRIRKAFDEKINSFVKSDE